MTGVTDEEVTKGIGEKLADIIEERFDDDDGIWRLLDEDIAAIIEIADGMEWPEGEEPNRDAVLIEVTSLVLQQRILYREKKGPGSR